MEIEWHTKINRKTGKIWDIQELSTFHRETNSEEEISAKLINDYEIYVWEIYRALRRRTTTFCGIGDHRA